MGYYLSGDFDIIGSNLNCGFNVEFKDEKTKDLWLKLHKKKCEKCNKKLHNNLHQTKTIKNIK